MEVTKPPMGDIALTNSVGNVLPEARLREIRGVLRHYNWSTERPQLVQRLSELSVHGDVDAAAQTGTFYDYVHMGWVIAKVVAS